MQKIMIGIGRLYVHRKNVLMYILASLAYIIAVVLRKVILHFMETVDLLWELTKYLLKLLFGGGFCFGLFCVTVLAFKGTWWAIAILIAFVGLMYLFEWWACYLYQKNAIAIHEEYLRRLKKRKYQKECWRAWNEYYSRRYQKLLPCKCLIKVQ